MAVHGHYKASTVVLGDTDSLTYARNVRVTFGGFPPYDLSNSPDASTCFILQK